MCYTASPLYSVTKVVHINHLCRDKLYVHHIVCLSLIETLSDEWKDTRYTVTAVLASFELRFKIV